MEKANQLQAAIAHLERLKEEHAPIVEQISSDPGMSPETRSLLLEHLHEEEVETADQITALGGSAQTTLAGPPNFNQGLTVGSLRKDTGFASTTLGSLRNTQ